MIMMMVALEIRLFPGNQDDVDDDVFVFLREMFALLKMWYEVNYALNT